MYVKSCGASAVKWVIKKEKRGETPVKDGTYFFFRPGLVAEMVVWSDVWMLRLFVFSYSPILRSS